jgi:Tfp pilus assembly protein FimV
VSDQDFNFEPPPERRPPKPFEPPPWEKAQFEELERRKAEEAARAAQAAAEARAAQEAAEAQPQVAEDAATGAAAQVAEPVIAADTVKSVPKAPITPGEERLTQAGVSERQFEAMLIGLRTEEPPIGRGLWKISLVAGVFVLVVGLVLAIWGSVALMAARKTGATGALGGMVLLFFGVGFAGVGVWLAFRTLREQGVL